MVSYVAARIAQYRVFNIYESGTNPDYPTYVAIKGTVFDVTGNKAYGPEGSYKGMSRHDVSHSPWSHN
jgi:cytochrome b involved in lipid metabolism